MRGSEQHLEELVRRYATLIRGAVTKVLGRRDDAFADDVLARVTESLWKQLQREQTIEHPKAYLYRCAVRETVRLLQRELDRDELPIEHADAVGSAIPTPDRALEARELAVTTDAMLDALAPDRAAAVRAHLAGFSVEEIMAMHGWRYQKARNLIARGIADLRSRLRESGVA